MTDGTHIRDEFPNQVIEIEHTWIPMSDGIRLSARIWMPEYAVNNPLPAILEYIPYRKRDDEAEMQKYVDPNWNRILPRW